jgi:hypothetical protein
MTPDMIARARTSAMNQGFTNVEFHLATIDDLPLEDASADVVISNCVINLAPDKPAVFREIFRVLKPGGRVAVSDIALKKPLPPEIGNDLLAYVGCIAGAILINDYVQALRDAGFKSVQVVDTQKDLNAYTKVDGQSGCCSSIMENSTSDCCTPAPIGSSACCTPKPEAIPQASGCCTPAPAGSTSCCTPTPAAESTVHGKLAELLSRHNVNDFAASVRVYAVKS